MIDQSETASDDKMTKQKIVYTYYVLALRMDRLKKLRRKTDDLNIYLRGFFAEVNGETKCMRRSARLFGIYIVFCQFSHSPHPPFNPTSL